MMALGRQNINGNAENAERRLRNEKSISLVDFVSRNYRRFICWGIPDVYKGDFDTSQEAWTPPDAPSLFAKVLIPDTDTIPEWEQPDSTNPYAKGDKVTHNGKTWISTADGNVWEPGVYGWEEV